MRAQPLAVLIVILVLGLSACGTPSPTEVAVDPPGTPSKIPSRTPEPKPTATPTEAFTIPANVDELIGIWQNPAISTHRFNANGTLEYAHSVEALASPLAVDKYWIEHGKLFIQEVSVSGVAPCGKGGVATYEVKLLVSGRMKLRAIDEMCNTRKGATEGIYDAIK